MGEKERVVAGGVDGEEELGRRRCGGEEEIGGGGGVGLRWGEKTG
jgi:hypothetical protein